MSIANSTGPHIRTGGVFGYAQTTDAAYLRLLSSAAATITAGEIGTY